MEKLHSKPYPVSSVSASAYYDAENEEILFEISSDAAVGVVAISLEGPIDIRLRDRNFYMPGSCNHCGNFQACYPLVGAPHKDDEDAGTIEGNFSLSVFSYDLCEDCIDDLATYIEDWMDENSQEVVSRSI